MSQWFYLEHPAFQSRSVIAAHCLKDCKTIVEIGGYMNPISDFVTGSDKKIIIIDPLPIRTSRADIRLTQCTGSFLDCHGLNLLEEGYGLLALGLDLVPSDETTLSRFVELAQHSSKTIIEFANKFEPAIYQANYIKEHITYKKHYSFVLDFTHTDLTGFIDGHPPFRTREMWIFER